MNKQNKNLNNIANKIRTMLLIAINDELKKNKKHNHFFINSKPLKEYDDYNDYIILERDIIGTIDIYENKTSDYHEFFKAPRYKSIEEIIVPTRKLRISKRRNAIISIENKISLTKNLKLKKQYQNKQKLINHSIKVLRFYCSLLKSKQVLKRTSITRNNSEIIRRKKYTNIGSNSHVLSLKSDAMKVRKIKFENDNDTIIHLHKMYKPKKSSKNVIKKMKDFDYLKKEDSNINARNTLIFE